MKVRTLLVIVSMVIITWSLTKIEPDQLNNNHSYSEGDLIREASLIGSDNVIVKNGIDMVPVQQAAQSGSANVDWNPKDGNILVTDGNNQLNLFPGETAAYLNDVPITMPAAVEIIAGRSYISQTTMDQYLRKSLTGGTSLPRTTSGYANETSITIGAVGDCTLGSDPAFPYRGSFNEVYDMQTPQYFFSGVKQSFADNDLTLACLEGNFTYATAQVDKSFQGNEAFFFRAVPDYTNILLEGGIDAVSIANNHTSDFGDAGMLDTIHSLEKAGIGYFGYDYRHIVNIGGTQVGLLGRNDLGPIELGTDIRSEKWHISNDIKYLRKQGCAVVIIFFHWGLENYYWFTDRQEELGHYSIDKGADLVLGAHPHVLEPIEKYKGKYIAYSLGNFCFGGNNNPRDQDTIIFKISMTMVNGVITGSDINLVPCSISSSTDRNDYRPRVLYGSDVDRVLNKVPLI